MKTFKLKYSFPLLFLFTTIFIPSSWADLVEDFVRVNPPSTYNVQGNYAIAGNTILCLTERASGYGGVCHGMDDYELITSNMHVSKYLDIDNDANTWNSSSSFITLPSSFDTDASKGVLWAGLFWQGRISEDKDSALRYGEVNSSGSGYHFIETGAGSDFDDLDLSDTNADKILLKVNDGSYSTVESSTFYEFDSSGGITYAAYADVTSLVHGAISSDGKHTFTVANLTTNEGREFSPGIFGGWSIVVIYAEDDADEMQNISVYSGFDSVDGNDKFTIDNFILPTSGDVKSTLSLFAGEGEYRYGYKSDSTWGYDWVKISNDDSTYTSMPNAIHPNNIFDGRFTGISREKLIDASGTDKFNDLEINNVGVDIDSFDVSQLMTSYRDADPNINTMYIQWDSNWDYITPSMLVFATEIYVPEFCYDYAYKQQNKYFTETNDGNQDPRIVGTVIEDEPVEVSIYIKSLVDGAIQIQDMKVSVNDINKTQADLVPDSVLLSKTGDASREEPTYTTSSSAGADYIHDIDVGTLDENDYFYFYYTLDPNTVNLDMPIEVEASYTLNLDGVSSAYTLILGQHIPLCDGGAYDYSPYTGIFNIVHNDYYNDSSQYYNLPTQVTKRAGNFKVIATDPDDHDELREVSTVVAIDMIDVSSYQTTDAACREPDSAISERIWVVFDDASEVMFDRATLESFISSSNTITSATEFYAQARENTAFRVSYNVMDGNDSIPYLNKQNNGSWSLSNWSSSWTGEDCNQDMVTNGLGNDNRVASYCNLTGGSPDDIATCMECIYGKNTKFVCSRDNFAIRPEAFMIKLDDQNQTNATASTLRLADNISGVTATPSDTSLALAAGYNYKLATSAVNHIDTTPSLGYTRNFEANSTTDYFGYTWAPTGINSGCNDLNNYYRNFRIVDGYIDMNSSLNQVGEYTLSMRDTQWTIVDNNPFFMKHHVGDYFLDPDILDCVADSSITEAEDATTGNATPLNGCNISSNHTSSASSPLQYNNYDTSFHPYKFDMQEIMPQVGINHLDVNNTSFIDSLLGVPYVYMNDMFFDGPLGDNKDRDQNMSYHLNGTISAFGYNDAKLSNFVADCYAQDIDLIVSKSDTTLLDENGNQLPFQAKYQNRNFATGTTIISDDFDVTETIGSANPIIISIAEGNFTQDHNGSINTILNLNYGRAINVRANPKDVSFSAYETQCSQSVNCRFNADMIATKETTGRAERLLPEDNTIVFYYGRTHAPRHRFIGPGPHEAFIYYEVYCDGATCDRTLLQDGATSRYSDDPRWFINTQHTPNFGLAGDVRHKTNATIRVIGTTPNGNHPVVTNTNTTSTVRYITPDTTGYPYKTTMENNASGWLIYHPFNADANTVTTNNFEVEFQTDTSDWAGEKEDNTNTTDSTGSFKTNRRSMW